MKVQRVECSSEKRRQQLGVKIEAVTKDEYNMSALVWREKSIKALWNEGTPHYHALVAQLLEKENQLSMVLGTGGGGRSRCGSRKK